MFESKYIGDVPSLLMNHVFMTFYFLGYMLHVFPPGRVSTYVRGQLLAINCLNNVFD